MVRSVGEKAAYPHRRSYRTHPCGYTTDVGRYADSRGPARGRYEVTEVEALGTTDPERTVDLVRMLAV